MAEPETPPDDALDAPAPTAEDGGSADAADGSVVGDDRVTATLRRSPRYAVFLVLGAALGVIIALILTTAFNGSQQASEGGYIYSPGQVFGFLTLLCVPVGLVLAGTVALILDRTSSRRARELTVERERFRE